MGNANMLLERTLEALEWPQVLKALAASLRSDYGRTELAALTFLDDVEAVRRSLTLIQELKTAIRENGELDFGILTPIAPLLDRAEKQGRLEVAELAQVLAVQQATLRLRKALAEARELPGLKQLAEQAHLEEALVDELARAFTPAGDLSERTYPALGQLREQLQARRDGLHRRLEALLRTPALEPVLQEPLYTLRGHRYVIPVKTDFRGRVPGIVHDVSASGATLFIEPQEIVEDTNALTLAEKQLQLEVEQILKELSLRVGFAAPSLRHNLGWLGRMDLMHAQALLSLAWQATVPDVWQEGIIKLNGLAHPALLQEGEAQGGTPAVRNDLQLGAATRCLVVSGANTGGKTVLLKAVGLCALLVRCGMHIPAQAGSRCDLFTEVMAEIGDQQSLSSSLSTFSAQVRFLADVLARADAGSLVLLDELLTGTEPAQGSALAAEVLQMLVGQGAVCLVTTHYSDLKLLAGTMPGAVNAAVSFDPDRLRPTFRLEVGLPGASYAFPIALRHGLPQQLVERAQQRLSDRPAALDALLAQIQARAQRMDAQEQEMHRLEQQQSMQEAKLRRRSEELDELQQRLKRQERGMVSQELRAARQKIADVIRRLQQANSLPVAGQVREAWASLEQELLPAAPAPQLQPPQFAPAPGDAVYLPSLGQSGVLQAVLDGGNTARIQFGPITLESPLRDLTPPPPPRSIATPGRRGKDLRKGVHRPGKGTPPAGAAATVGGDAVPPVLSGQDNTLDVRGLRLHEALESADRFFDQCVMKHVSPVVLIHGHGTGRLKAGLRERLKSSHYVAALRPGRIGEGSDGVTIVALNL